MSLKFFPHTHLNIHLYNKAYRYFIDYQYQYYIYVTLLLHVIYLLKSAKKFRFCPLFW